MLVNGDVKQFQALIRQAAPGSSVQAIKVKDAVLLLGWVDQAGQATKIVELAEMHFTKVLNYLQVSGVQTIMLRVRMMEAQRSKIRALGFNFLQLRQHSYVGSLPGTARSLLEPAPRRPTWPIRSAASSGRSPRPCNPAAATAVFGTVANDNAFQGFIEALKQENLLTILAEPNLTTTNGRPANFLDGGQFPVPIPQGLGTVSIQYKSFGVQLEFVPTILSSGRLRMQVSPKSVEKDLSNTVTVQGITVPSLTTRRVNTEVEMNFGETLIIAGLISNQVQATTSKIPFFGELPWIGAAFRRVAPQRIRNRADRARDPRTGLAGRRIAVARRSGTRHDVARPIASCIWNGYLETPRYAPDPEPPPTNFGYPVRICRAPPAIAGPRREHVGPRPAYDGDGARPPAPAAQISRHGRRRPTAGNGSAAQSARRPWTRRRRRPTRSGARRAAPARRRPASPSRRTGRLAASRRAAADGKSGQTPHRSRIAAGPDRAGVGSQAPAAGVRDASGDRRLRD